MTTQTTLARSATKTLFIAGDFMERTPYQDKIIKRYYENKPEIMRQKLNELVTDLYLAETPKEGDDLETRRLGVEKSQRS